jgi:hypothetical protein
VKGDILKLQQGLAKEFGGEVELKVGISRRFKAKPVHPSPFDADDLLTQDSLGGSLGGVETTVGSRTRHRPPLSKVNPENGEFDLIQGP